MPLDETKLRDTLRAIHDRLTTSDASAIVDVARIAASANGTDPDELAAIAAISKVLYGLAGASEVPAPSPTISPARLLEIGNQLEDTGKRELAYACAMAVMQVDLQLTAEERGLGEQLAGALLLEAVRARELSERVQLALTAKMTSS